MRFDYIPLTVSFGANGGSGQMASITNKNIDSKFALSSNQFARVGYSFAGWTNKLGTAFANKANVVGSNFWHKSSWSFKSALYAKWTAKKSALTFNANGGTGTMTTGRYATFGQAMPTGITLPTRTGYAFAGFFDAPSGGTQYYNANGSSARTWNKDTTSGTTLYAQWTGNKYEYRFSTHFSFYEWARSSSAALQQSSGSGGSLSFDKDAGTVSIAAGSTVPVNSDYSRSVETYSNFYKVSISESAATRGTQFTFYCKLSGTSTSCCVDWAEYDANGEIIQLRNLGNVSASVGSYVKTFTVSSNCRAVQFVFVNRTANSSVTFSDIGLNTSVDYGYGVPNPLRKILTYSETQKVGSLPTGVSRTGYSFDWVCWVNGAHVTVTSDTTMASLGAGDKWIAVGNWTANTYTVTLDRQSGSGGSSSVTATYNSAMPAATMPTRTGYVFGGYYTDTSGGGTQYYTSAGASARSWNIANNATLYAKWTAKTSALTFNANGGSGAMTTGKVATYGQAMPTGITLPTKTGYTFNGFFDATSGGTKYYNANGTSARTWNKDTTSGTTLYAQWTVKTSALSFHANGGSGTMTPGKVATYGQAMPTDIALPARTGYAFAGFYDAISGGTQYYDANGSSARTWDKDTTSGTTLYAHWTAKTSALTFNANGGSGAMTTGKVATYDAEMPTEIVRPTRIGYTFAGFYDEGSGGTKYYDANGSSARTWDKDTTSGTTLYAHWQVNHYTVQYKSNCDGSTGTMDDQSRDYGVPWNLSKNQFVRTGYEFREWTTKADGSGSKYGDGASVSDLSSEDGATVTLYAQWTPIAYSIEFDGGTDASGTMETISDVKYDEEVVLPANGFAKPGCEFQGWKYSALTFEDGATVSNLTTAAGATVKLDAMWDAPYWVAFDANGGVGEMAVQRFEAGEADALYTNKFARTGYTFGGWATNAAEAAALIAKYDDGAVVSNLTDKVETNTLYAVWNTNAYYVAFNPNGGTGGPMEPQKFFYDQQQNLAANAYSFVEHWILDGWSDSVNGVVYDPGEKVVNLCTEANDTNTLFAVWKFVPGPLSDVLDCGNLYFEANTDSGWEETSAKHAGSSSLCQDGGAAKGSPDSRLLKAVITNDLPVVRTGRLSFWWAGQANKGMDNKSAILSFIYAGKTNTYAAVEGMATTPGATPGEATVSNWSNVVQTIVIPAGGSVCISFANALQESANVFLWIDDVKWEWTGSGDVEYAVAYDPNCGDSTGTMTNETRSCGVTWNLSTNEFVRAGYEFVGWNTEPGGGGDSYEDGAEVVDLSYEAGATVVLYAQWTPTEDPGGGGGGYPSVYSEALDCSNLCFEAAARWNITESEYQHGSSSMYQEGEGSVGGLAWLTASITNKSDSARQGTFSFWWAGEVKGEVPAFKKFATLSFAYGGQTDEYTATEGMVSEGHVLTWSNVVQAIEIPAGGSIDVSFATASGNSKNPLVVWVDHVAWTWGGEGGDVPGPEDARDISNVTFEGGVLSLSFTNADERFSYNLRGTNDLVAPLALWPVLWTTNGTGNITITPPSVPSAPQFFYYLETTAK